MKIGRTPAPSRLAQLWLELPLLALGIRGDLLSSTFRTIQKATTYRWAASNIPAWRDEPLMTTPEDFRAKINLQMIAVSKSGFGSTTEELVMVPGEKLATNLMEAENFGLQLAPSQILRARIDSLAVGLYHPEEKMRRMYDDVRTTMTWNGEYGIYANEKLDLFRLVIEICG
jgi:hypothetical protein